MIKDSKKISLVIGCEARNLVEEVEATLLPDFQVERGLTTWALVICG